MLCCVCRGNFWKCSSLGLEKHLICFIHMQRIIQHSSVCTLVWMSKLPVEPKECCTAVTSAARTVSASSPENELSGIKNGTDNNAKRWIMHFEDLATFVIKIPSVHWVSQRDDGVCACVDKQLLLGLSAWWCFHYNHVCLTQSLRLSFSLIILLCLCFPSNHNSPVRSEQISISQTH